MGRKKQAAPASTRPQAPEELVNNLWQLRFVPAPELREWVNETFLAEGAPLFNPEHAHLEFANIGFLWATSGYVKAGRRVLGQTEDLRLPARGNAWQRGRIEQQLADWFGEIPDFLITLDAFYSRECSDPEFCALVEHELYHVGQVRDEFGAPKFKQDGTPKLAIRGHDVEEFVGVVRRYGVGENDTALADLVIAAAQGPEIARVKIAQACGTCRLRAA